MPSFCAALPSFTLVTHDAYSHINVSENILPDLDHFLVSWQGWQLQQMSIQASVSPPEYFWAKGLSDHAMVSFSVSSKKPRKSNGPLPIPPWVAKLPRFAEIIRALVDKADLPSLLIPTRLKHYTELLHEAARLAGNEHCSARQLIWFFLIWFLLGGLSPPTMFLWQ